MNPVNDVNVLNNTNNVKIFQETRDIHVLLHNYAKIGAEKINL